jgi:four helix bundle protein
MDRRDRDRAASGFGLRASDFRLQAPGSGLRASGFGLRASATLAHGLLSLPDVRDYRKLQAFQKADSLVADVYKWTESLPVEENYVLRSQIRRSAISVPANIVEGSARTTHREYVNHLNIALGSAAELRYLIDLAGRIYPTCAERGKRIPTQAEQVVRILVGLIDALKARAPEREDRARRS